MNIKLISPRLSLRPMDSEYKRVLSPSISLLVVAALTSPEHHVYLEDENVKRLNLDDNPDLVGVTVTVDTSHRAYDIADHYRQKNIPVVFGGIHAGANTPEALAHADSVCIGEAEHLWPQIIADAQNHRLQKTYYHNQPTDLSLTPLPRWDLLNQSDYLYTSIVSATRGCPFSCQFCYNSSPYIHPGHRFRPIENVIAEIEALGTRQVMFIDDNFFGTPDWTRRFLHAIKPMNLRWHAAVSTNIGQHPDMLDLMRDTGCESLFIGFETINAESNRSVRKTQNHIDQYHNTIRQIHNRAIMINASMAFGFDHDCPDVFTKTLDWLVHHKIETMTAHILTPYPGTKLYQKLKKENRIIDHNPTHYNTSHVVFQPKNLTPQQLYDGYLWIYLNFYSFKNIFRRLPENPSQRTPYLLFNFGYRKFGKLTSWLAKRGAMNAVGKLARRLCYNIE